MLFEWDDVKEKINIAKHGIDFGTAALVFRDENRIEFYDEAHSTDEDRYITIGQINGYHFKFGGASRSSPSPAVKNSLTR